MVRTPRSIWIISLILAVHPLTARSDTRIDLDLSRSQGPNKAFGKWTESGLATNELSYHHKSGVTVKFSVEGSDSKLVRTMVNGKYGIGIDGTKVDNQEELKVSISGDYEMATISKMRFSDVNPGEVIEISAPGLAFYQRNGGRVGTGFNTTAEHDDERGVTKVSGITIKGAKLKGNTSVTFFFGPGDREGFHLAKNQSITIKGVQKDHDFTFVTLSLFIKK